jgi:hypothetical protein
MCRCHGARSGFMVCCICRLILGQRQAGLKLSLQLVTNIILHRPVMTVIIQSTQTNPAPSIMFVITHP